MPWYTARADGAPGDGARSTMTLRLQQGPCGCRCSGSTGPTRISAALPADRQRQVSRRATRIRVQPSGARARVARIVDAADGDLPRPSPGRVDHADAGPTRSTSRAAT
jgi:hypothetical protein